MKKTDWKEEEYIIIKLRINKQKIICIYITNNEFAILVRLIFKEDVTDDFESYT